MAPSDGPTTQAAGRQALSFPDCAVGGGGGANRPIATIGICSYTRPSVKDTIKESASQSGISEAIDISYSGRRGPSLRDGAPLAE